LTSTGEELTLFAFPYLSSGAPVQSEVKWLNPLQLFGNHYLCNFVPNDNVENFLTYENDKEMEFKCDNAINFCIKCKERIDNCNFYKKMIKLVLGGCKLDTLKILKIYKKMH